MKKTKHFGRLVVLGALFLAMSGSARADDASDAVAILQDANSPIPKIEEALSVLKAHGSFNEPAGLALLRLLDKDFPAELRGKMAKIFYLLFYDKRGVQQPVYDFLMKENIKVRVERLMLFDSQADVRKYTAEIGQVLISSFEKAQAEKLAEAYLPILLRGLRHSSAELRNEIFVALDNLSETDAFRRSKPTREALQQLLLFGEQEKQVFGDDPDLADFIDRLKENISKLL